LHAEVINVEFVVAIVKLISRMDLPPADAVSP
jgi:hypothetical protein